MVVKSLALTSGLVLAAAAQAATLGSLDFNGSTGGWDYIYGNGGNGPMTRSLVPASGMDGSQAKQMTFDFTPTLQESWGTWFGGGAGQWFPADLKPISTNPADYAFSADLKFVGTYDGTKTGIKMEVAFQVPDDTLADGSPNPTPDANTDADSVCTFLYTMPVTFNENAWQTVSYTLDQFAVSGGAWSNVALAQSNDLIAGYNVTFKFDDSNTRTNWGEANPALWAFAAPGGFGKDAGNEMWVDNFLLTTTVVPEPTVLFGGLAASALLFVRKRQK